eukprot:799284-Amphidinium_carterae.1
MQKHPEAFKQDKLHADSQSQRTASQGCGNKPFSKQTYCEAVGLDKLHSKQPIRCRTAAI